VLDTEGFHVHWWGSGGSPQKVKSFR